MRTVWVLCLILFVGAAAVLAYDFFAPAGASAQAERLRYRSDSAPVSSDASAASTVSEAPTVPAALRVSNTALTPPVAEPTAPAVNTPEVAVQPAAAAATVPVPEAAPVVAAAPLPVEAPKPASESKPAAPAVPSETLAAAPKPAAPASDAAVLEDLSKIAMPGSAGATDATPAKPDASEAGAASEFVIPESPAFPADKIIPSKAVRKDEKTLVFDGRFPLKGNGTKEDPYRVSFDLLVSAQETYKPRTGQTRLPQRVTFLHDKYVRISGFIAFPITSTNPKELLVMLNQWDGCCIGVPPTAYDAIEVKLTTAASAQQRFTSHGTVEGKLKVDPYTDGGWLLGLYLLEDAKLTAD